MSPTILDLLRGALATAAEVAAPFLVLALTVGLVTALIQAATQLQENVLSFVPKIVALGLCLALAGPWALERLERFGVATMDTLVSIGREAGR